VGVLLALFFGVFGAHHFYLRRTGLGILYICLTLTLVGAAFTGIASFIECFFMPGRVREFNAREAAFIAASLGIPVPLWGAPLNGMVNVPPPTIAAQPGPMIPCPRCQQANVVGARFCSGCGGTF
jgi:hypothetical protein